MSKLLVFTLLLSVLISLFSGVALANDFAITSARASPEGNGVLVELRGEVERINFLLHDGNSLAFAHSQLAEGDNLLLEMPNTHYLPHRTFTLTAWGICYYGISTRMFVYDIPMGRNFGVGSASQWELPPVQERMVSISTPFANVFSFIDMQTVVHTLAQHERVYAFPTLNPYITFIDAYINPPYDYIVYDVINGVPTIQNNERVSGFVYTAAISSGIFKNPEQIRLDASEIARSRKGLHGMYSQSRRWALNNVDCSSFVAWVMREAGVASVSEFGKTAGVQGRRLDDLGGFFSVYGSTRPFALAPEAPPSRRCPDRGEVSYEIISENFYCANGTVIEALTYDNLLSSFSELAPRLKIGDTLYFARTISAYYQVRPYWHVQQPPSTCPETGEIIRRRVRRNGDVEMRARENTFVIYYGSNPETGITHTGIYIGNGLFIHTGRDSNVPRDFSVVVIHQLSRRFNDVVFVGRPLGDS